MQVLSLKGCSQCGSHTRALPGLSLILRMFSPPLPSLPFQACRNCSQCVYTHSHIECMASWRCNLPIEIPLQVLLGEVQQVSLCFQMREMQVLKTFSFPSGICSSPNFCDMEEFFPRPIISSGKEKPIKILSC